MFLIVNNIGFPNMIYLTFIEYQQQKNNWISNPLCGSKVESAFHPSEVDQMYTRNFSELSEKK